MSVIVETAPEVMVTRGRSVVGRVARLPASDWRAVAEAQWRLLAAQLLLWRRPIGELVVTEATAEPAPAPPTSIALPTWSIALRAAVAVRRAAEQGIFRPRCLVRSIALTRMLEARGIRGSQIRIGVQGGSRDFAAHAWVELGGRVLGDAPRYVRSFVQVTTVRIV